MPAGYVRSFAQKPALVLTEKLDGQNNCFNRYGVFARSHAAPSQHPWDKPLRERWQHIRHDLGDLELFGENLYGIHSIAYHALESYYYLFAVREGGRWLGWEEVQYYAALFDFPIVPEIPITTPLSALYDNKRDENRILADWLTANLGMPWTDAVGTAGALGGYDPASGTPAAKVSSSATATATAPTTATRPLPRTNLTTSANSCAPNTSKPTLTGAKSGSPLASWTIRNTAGTPTPIGATEHVDLPALPPRARPRLVEPHRCLPVAGRHGRRAARPRMARRRRRPHPHQNGRRRVA